MKAQWTTLSLGCLIAIGASWAAHRALSEHSAADSAGPTAAAAATRAAQAHADTAARARAASATAAAAPFSLQAPVAYSPSDASPVAYVAIGDTTGDGRDDLVTGRTQAAVFAQSADGQLSAGRLLDNVRGMNALTLANLNGDTLADIVVGHGAGITALVADGSGGYHTQPYTRMIWRTETFDRLAVADLDGDGDEDVFAANANYILGFFSGWQAFTTTPDGPTMDHNFSTVLTRDLKAGDFDGDGLADLVTVGNQAGSGIARYASDSLDLQPRSSLASPDTRYAPTAVAAGDFNGDGRTDYAMAAVDANDAMKLWIYPADATGQPGAPALALEGQNRPIALIATDLDRDGRTDLAVMHEAGVGIYLQGADGLQAEQYLPLGQFVVATPQAFAAGDLNGDGCTDLAVAAGAPGALVLYGQNCAPAPAPVRRIAHDVDQDGKSDLLWRYPAGGHWGYWLMDGAQRRSASDYPLDPALRSLAVGRYAAEDRLDVLWADNEWIWISRVRAGNGSVPLFLQRRYPSGYRVVASGDIDGDGVDDVLWRDDANTVVSAWAMSHLEVRAGKSYFLPPSWRIVGSGDFTGDGRLDLIWTDGQKMRLWAGAANLSFADRPMGGYPVGWELAGTGDVDGDGRADLFWRRADLNAFVIWYMDGGRRTGGDSYTVDASWRVLDSGDFDGDGKTDLVWTNGQLMQLWQSKGRSFLGLPMADYPQSWTAIKN